MVISKNSQLGLMELDRDLMIELLEDHRRIILEEKDNLQNKIDELSSYKDGDELSFDLQSIPGEKVFENICDKLGYKVENKGAEFYTVKHPNAKYYLVQRSVEDCAKMIRIKDNFSCSIFSKIKDGEHIYLLGKNQFFRFVKFNGAIRGSYWNRDNKEFFEVGFDLDEDVYYFPVVRKDSFNRLVRLMVFIKVGDIETVILNSGRNNGKTKSDGKITNTSNHTVYVVDSSWNKLIIRTDGFSVMGHFRLQPCGSGMTDRKLIWINSFQKDGYTRKPKATIIHD